MPIPSSVTYILGKQEYTPVAFVVFLSFLSYMQTIVKCWWFYLHIPTILPFSLSSIVINAALCRLRSFALTTTIISLISLTALLIHLQFC